MTYMIHRIETRHRPTAVASRRNVSLISEHRKKKTILKLKPLKRIELKSDFLIQKRNNETFLEIKDFLWNYFL